MILRNRFVKSVITLAVAVVIAIAATTNKTQAFRPTAVEYHFGMVGLTRSETARLNVINLGRETLSISINFVDSSGRVLGRSVERLEPDHATFLDFTPSSVDIGPGRLQIHAWFEYETGGSPKVIPSLELFDNDTGKTRLVLGACDGSV